jgi:hypothetical protein
VFLTSKPGFNAATVVAIKMLNDARRVEIRFADAAGVEHVVSLPLAAALELAKLISEVPSFMTRLKQRPGPASGS